MPAAFMPVSLRQLACGLKGMTLSLTRRLKGLEYNAECEVQPILFDSSDDVFQREPFK